MPRRANFSFSSNPFHITARCVNKEPFKIPLEDVWDILQNYLFLTNKAFEIQIHAFVLMKNHWHLIAHAPNQNLSAAMNYLMRESSRSILFEADRINQTYGGRHHKSELTTTSYYLNAYKYLYRNPVAVGLTNFCEEYKFSTLGGLMGFRKFHIPTIEDHTLFSNVEDTLAWLNRTPKPENAAIIGRALRHTTMHIPNCRGTKRKHPLTNQLI